MADQQRKVSLIFDADASRAKKQIDDLANSLNRVMNISTRSFGVGSVDKELRNAAQSAALLQSQLKEAVNVKTGKLDLAKFNESIKRGGIGLEEYQKTLTSMGSVGEQAFTNLARSIATAEIPLRKSNTLLNDFATTMKNTVKWQLSSSLMHGFLSSVQSAMSYAQHLNKNLTDIRIVTGQSADDMARFAEAANKSAKELSTTTNQYAQAALIFYQQGLSDKAVKERTDAVIKMANVTGEAAKDVSSYMTAIWNNFDDGSKNLEYYADVITKLGAATAASSEEIAGGLEKFAAIGNTIGLSYEYATAMLTTIIDKTRQSEDVVGTALKTILARIQGLKLGETLEDGTDLNKYSQALETVGVSIKDASGELRDMDSILDDLGSKWQTLSKDTQVALAQTVGGVRQYNQIISLMENWDAFKLNVDIAFDSEGSLNEQAEIYAESWEAVQNRVRAAMESIYSSLIDDKFFIGFNNVLAEGIGVIESFIENLGGLKGTIATLGTVFISVFGSQLTGALKNATYNLKMMTKSGRDEMISIKEKAQDLLSTQSANKATRGGSTTADVYKQEAASQMLLLNNAKKLSAVEEEVANTLMRQIQLRTDQQIAAGLVADAAERELDRQTKIVQRYLEQKNLKTVGPENINVGKLATEILEVNQALPQLSTLDDIFLEIAKGEYDAELKLNNFKNAITSFPIENLPNGIAEDFKKLKTTIDASTDFESAKKAWDDFFIKIQDRAIQIPETLTKLRNSLATLKQQDVADADQISQLELLIRMFEELEKKARDAGKAYDDSNKTQANATQANKALEEYLSRVGIQIVSNQQKIVTYAQTFSSLAMALNQLRGTWDLLNDSQASGMDKLLSMMMTLGVTIPTVINLTKSLTTLGKSKVILYAKTQLVEAGFKGEALAAEIAKHSSVSFGQALKAIAPELIAIGAIFATLAFVVPKIVEWMNKKPEGLADSLKQLKEESQNFDAALSETKAEAKNVQDIFDQYNSVHDALNTCEENTREWRDRLQEVKQLESDILADNPQILEFMKLSSSLGYNSAKYTNNSGQLDFNAVLTDYQDYLKQQTVGMTLGKIQTEEEISDVDYLTTNFEGRNNYMGDIDWGTMTAYISAGEAGMIPYQMDMGDRIALNEAASGTTFLRDAESMYADIGGADWAAGLLSEGHTQDSFVRGMAEYVYRWGLQQGYATYEEAAQAYIDSLPEKEQGKFTTTITSFDGNVQGGTWAEIMQSALGENYYGYAAMYAADASTALNKDIAANAFLPSLFSQYDLTSYTPEIEQALSGNFGQAVANSMLDSLDLDSIPLELAISNYERNKEGVTLELLDDGSGNYRSIDAEGNEIASNITTDQIKLSSDMGIQMIRELNLGEHIETALLNIPETLRDYVLSGDFKSYTADELQSATIPEEYNTYLAEMYGENYRQIIQDELTSAQGVSNNFSGPAELTYGNMLEYNALSPAAQAILMDPTVQSTIEDYNAFFDALDTPMGVGAGMESLIAFTSLLKEFGIVLEEDSESYQRLSQEMTQGELGINHYEGFTPDNLKSAQTLVSGGSLTDKELAALTGAGLDINLLQSPRGKDYLSGVISDYSMAAMEAHAAKEEIRYDPDSKLYTYDNLEGINTVASAFGYEPINADIFSRGNQYGWNKSHFGQEAQEALDAVDFDTISANLATFGIEYAEVIKGFGEEHYNKYLDTMIQAQAELDEIEISSDIFNAEDPLQAYKDLIKNIKLDEALTSFIDNYSSEIESGLMQDLVADSNRTISEDQQVSDFKQRLADMFGVTVDTINTMMESPDFWKNIEALGSGDPDLITAAFKNLGIEETNINFIDTLVRHFKEEAELVANYALANAANAFADGNITELTYKQVSKARNLLTTTNEDGETVQNTEEIDLALIEAGILDKKTRQLTDEASDIYKDADEARQAYVEAVNNYYNNLTEALTVDPNSLSDPIEKARASILQSDELKGLIEKNLFKESDIKNLTTSLIGAKKAGGSAGLQALESFYKQAGDNAFQLAEEFANIDWDNVTFGDLENIFNDLGISTEGQEEALYSLIDAMDSAIEFTNSLTEALNNYASDTEMADKLRNGEDISTEDYARAEEIFGKEKAQEMFSLNADGSYGLAEDYSGSLVANLIDSNTIKDFAKANVEWSNANNLFGESGLVAQRGNENFIQSQSSDMVRRATDTSLGYIYENLDTLFPEVDSEAAGKQIANFQEQRDETNLADLLETFKVSDLSELFNSEVQSGLGRQAEESEEAYEDARERIPRENQRQAWEREGFSEEDIDIIDKYGDEIQEAAKESEYFADSLEHDAAAADEIASEIMRYNRGLETAISNTKDWGKSLKESKKGSEEYIRTTEEMTGALEDIYDLGEGDLEGLDLDWDRLNKDMKTMAEGSGEEAAAAYQDGMDHILDAMILKSNPEIDLDTTQFDTDIEGMTMSINEWQAQMYDALNGIEAGGIIPDALLTSLASMLSACFSTVDEAQAALTEMGVDGIVTMADEPTQNVTPTNDIQAEVTDYGTIQPPILSPLGPGLTLGPPIPIQGVNYSTVPDSAISEGSVTNVGFKIVPGEGKTSVTKKAGAGTKATQGTRPTSSGTGRRGGGGGGRRPRRGGGGGGGGSRAPTADRKKDSDKERYRTIKNQLEDLTDSYDKVSKSADRAFGKARVLLLKDQQKELKKLASAQKDYIDEINAYYKQDLSNLDKVSAFSGVKIELDKNGTITNYDAIQDAMWADYNSHINDAGEVTGMDEEAWKKYEEEWEDMMGLIEQYEETQDLRKEALQQLQDYINEIYDLQLEEVTYTVEVNIDSSEYALEILDYLLGKIEDDAWEAAEAINYMGKQAEEFLEQSDIYTSGIRGILENHTRDITDANGDILQKANLTQADVEGFMNGDKNSIEKIKNIGLSGGFTDEEVQTLKDYHSQLISTNQSLLDLRESVFDKVLEAFESFNEELEKGISKLEHLSNITQAYRDIVDLVGKDNLGISDEFLRNIGQGQVEQSINILGANKNRRDTLETMVKDAEAKRDEAIRNGYLEDEKLWNERIETMKEQLDEAEEAFMDSWNSALEAMQAQFELHMGGIIETLSDALAGPMGKSLDELQDAFNRTNELAEMYLPDYEKIYELNKLNRDITNSIDETDNVKAKQELAELQAEINELEKDGVQVSQYQTEDLRRRYELKLAEIALNEAQNTKSQVQMTRSADGNWSYVYTADEEDVAAAEQSYEDRLFALQQANADYINQMQEMLIQAETDLVSKIEEITSNQALSMEEQQAMIDEVTAHYTEKFSGYAGELELVLDNNAILYENDWTLYSERTGYKISADEEYVDRFNETALKTLTGFTTIEGFHQNFLDASKEMLDASSEAYESWGENLNRILEEAGTDVQDFAEEFDTQVQNAIDDSERLSQDIKDTGSDIEQTFADITTAVSNWESSYTKTIDTILEKNTALATSFNTVLASFKEFQVGTGVTDTGTGTGEGEGEGGEGEGNENGDSEAMGQITIQKGYQYWGYKSPKGGDKNRVKVVNDDRKQRTYKFTQMDTSTRFKRVYIPSEGVWVSSYDPNGPKRIKVEKFDTGGYTGAWGSEGKMAMLHEKELVLNKQDTSNLLNAVSMIRQIASVIDLNAYSSAGFGGGMLSAGRVGSTGTLEQVVHVTAEFPNATNREEIYAAFGDIVNLASQYANR